MTLRQRAIVLAIVAAAAIAASACAIVVIADALLEEEASLDGRGASAVDDDTRELLLAVGIAFGLLAGLVIAFGWLGWAWVLRPLLAIRRAAARTAHPAGLTAPIEVDGPPEIREVAAAAERLRREVVRRRDEARAAHEGLRQEAPLTSAFLARTRAPVVMEVGGIAVASRLNPAEGVVGGDWRDVVPRPDGQVAVVIGDVSGHGASAGIDALTCWGTAHASLLAGDPLEHAAELVRGCLDGSGNFATCFLAIVDGTSVTWLSAGHVQAWLVRADGSVAALEATGPLLSPAIDARHRTGTASFDSAACLFAVTDGILERGIGEDGLASAIRRAWTRHPGDPLTALEDVIASARAALRDDWPDDATAMAVCRSARAG